jgi:A/G-specific adenine glycosylase
MSKPPLDLADFRARLLAWYDRHQRPLPWRQTKSPYRIWISEIMLQQTRVAVVIARYHEFLRRFPSLRLLAAARESEVLAAWSGLGYYRRARSLRNAARVVVRNYKGRIPRQLEDLKQLPGIGDYTAAAIASIAFGQPHAVVDGNVRRVLARVTGNGITASSAWKHAQTLLSPARPGDFNEAMMELGATVCLPVPDCGACPVGSFCATKGAHARSTREKPAARVSVRVLLSARKGSVYLVRRRKSASVMPAMWELPIARKKSGEELFALKHSVMNTTYSVQVQLAKHPPTGASGRWISHERLDTVPLTGLARKILHRAGILTNQFEKEAR